MKRIRILLAILGISLSLNLWLISGNLSSPVIADAKQAEHGVYSTERSDDKDASFTYIRMDYNSIFHLQCGEFTYGEINVNSDWLPYSALVSCVKIEPAH